MKNYKQYFKKEYSNVKRILKAKLGREPAKVDICNVNIIKKLKTSKCDVYYKGEMIGSFVNNLEYA